MTETFAIGRSSATSPFREESLSLLDDTAEDFAPPAEPESSPPGEDLLESTEEAYVSPEEDLEGERPTSQVPAQGQSPIAVQAARQWDATDRPVGWIGKVYGLVVHTTGGGLPSKAKATRIYHTAYAVNYYTGPKSHGCHYVNGWRGVTGGDLLQIANEREQANGVGVGDQRRSIDQGRFEKDLPASIVTQWRARWPGIEHPLRLLPGTQTANSCYVHVECVPCVFNHGKRLITDAEPMRPGLRFTQAQHEAVALLACDIARRNGWPLQEKWWRSPRLLGHEDLTPFNRHDKLGGWDPGGMRAAPYFDWDFVYSMIEREYRARSALAPGRLPWPFSAGAEDEPFTATSDHEPSEDSGEIDQYAEALEAGGEAWERDWENKRELKKELEDGDESEEEERAPDNSIETHLLGQWMDIWNLPNNMTGAWPPPWFVRARDKVSRTSDDVPLLPGAQPFWPLQLIEKASSADANMDLYQARIDQMPLVDGSRLDHRTLSERVRLNLNDFVSTVWSSFQPADAEERAIWVQRDARGAIITINAAGPDDFNVMCIGHHSTESSAGWIFSTMTTGEKGRHALSGNREFGIREQDGTWRFFTRAIDRWEGWLNAFDGRYLGFGSEAQDRLWRSLVSHVVAFVADNGGSAVELPPTKKSVEWRFLRPYFRRQPL